MTGAVLLAAAVSCYPVTGARITGADFQKASQAFQALPAETIIGYAPRPGATRFFGPAELVRIAKANGLDATGVAPLCFQRAAAPLDEAGVIAAMRRSLGDPEARIDIAALSKLPAPPGNIVFPRDWLSSPSPARDVSVWNGYVEYDGGRFPIWARAHVSVRRKRVIAAVPLKPGTAVGPADVKVEDAEGFPERTLPLADIGEAVGRIPRRNIAAGTALTAAALEAPYDVARGDAVMVEVRSGGAVLKLEAQAEAAGRRGDTIPVRNPAGKIFRARVEEKGQVLVEASK